MTSALYPSCKTSGALAQQIFTASQPMSAQELVAILVLALGTWMLWTSLKAREAAIDASCAACRAEGYLFLDDTVGIEAVGA